MNAISKSKIFVGNLSFETSAEDLKELLSEMGEIKDVYAPKDRDTGRPRGFAFVEFDEESAATQAIEKFNGHELNGRQLRVNLAEERKPGGSRPSYGGGGYSNDAPSGGGGGGYSRPKGSRRGSRGKKRSL